MKRILIADASKASLVMTSEVFKDHFPGVQVVVARTSADAIELAKNSGELDAFIIDYDLPDRDGAFTAARLKKMFSQPILITAFDRPDVQQSIDRDLSAFDDCLSWLKKPVKPELVVSLAQRFIEGQHRCQRRLNCSLPAFLEVEFMPAAFATAAETGLKMAKHQQVARVKVVAKAKSKKAVDSGKKSTKATKGSTAPKEIKSSASTVAKKSTSKSAIVKPVKAVKVAEKSSVTLTGKKSAKGKATAVVQPKNSVAAPKANPKQATPTAPAKPIRKIIPVIIDDVSLGGAKIRVNNQELLIATAGKGKGSQLFCDFREGQILNVYVPPGNIVEAGAEALEKWQKSQGKVLANIFQKDSLANAGKPAGEKSKLPTMAGLAGLARTAFSKTEADTVHEGGQSNGNVLRGEVRWMGSNETFTFCGLRSETVNVSKKLFESMIEIESRGRSQLSPMVSPNIPRTSKLNA